MDVIIRTDRKINKTLIADVRFRNKPILENFVDSLQKVHAKIYLVNKSYKGTKKITPKQIPKFKGAKVIDLLNVYDERLLHKCLRRNKSLSKATIKENKTEADLRSFGCLFQRKEYNPLSQFYIEPWGEGSAKLLAKTKITPNQVTYINIIISIFASYLLFSASPWALILFAVWVRFFHYLDIIDGHIARLNNAGSPFGQWIDGGGDKFIITLWYVAITVSLYFKTQNILTLYIGLVALFGIYIYNYLMLTSVIYFRNQQSSYQSSSKLKKNPISSFFLLFINYDIHLHLLTIAAIFNKLHWFLLFYAIYYNAMWVLYFLYYLIRNLTKKTAVEA